MLTNFEMCHPHPVLIMNCFLNVSFIFLNYRLTSFCFSYFDSRHFGLFTEKLVISFSEICGENGGSIERECKVFGNNFQN